jgi:hypothetical protein
MKIFNHVFEITLIVVIMTVFLHICYTKQFTDFMDGVLGKIACVGFIVFYTMVNKIYGVLMCLLVITYYQLDRTTWMKEGFFSAEGMCNAVTLASSSVGLGTAATNMVDLENALPQRKKSEFQKKHCTVDKQLTYRGLDVKRDMTTAVFSEVEFKNNMCNVCDPNCEFAIVSK